MYFLGMVWNPDKTLIEIGSFGIRYYSLMWLLAFLSGYYIMKRIFKRENQPQERLDSLFVYTLVATLLGARLGEVFFYSWDSYKDNLWEIFLPFKLDPFEFTGFAGLASHGAAIGIIIAMYLYKRKYRDLKVSWILDRIVIPVAFGGIFIRIGNFINSEIVGKVVSSDFSLGVKFIQRDISEGRAMRITGEENPKKAYDLIEHDPGLLQYLNEVPARHPVQLYEASGYVLVFLILWWVYWKTEKRKQPWFIFGLFLVQLWSVRFVMEFFKASQDGFGDGDNGVLSTGQWLSIPFILVGLYLLFRNRNVTQKV